MTDRETTAKLQAAVMRSYPLPEYATFFEVADATGGRQSLWADAVSMSLWPSRGLTITGFETSGLNELLAATRRGEMQCLTRPGALNEAPPRARVTP